MMKVISATDTIKKKEWIPNYFWEEETRDGFFVDKTRKKIWGVQIDLLHEIDRICKNHDIQYFAIGGTLLGAIRHQGFIPWDDDIDIAMLRKDYDKFCDICQSVIKDPYFFQTTYTEEKCHCDFARLCNSNTTGIRNSLKKMNNVNKGIFIDIFPLDRIPDNNIIKKIYSFRLNTRTVIATAYSLNVNRNPIAKTINRITNMKIVNFDLKQWDKRTEGLTKKYNNSKTKKIAIAVRTPFPPEKTSWVEESFNEFRMVPFEFFQIPIPIGYDHILSTQYGDYVKFPPVAERGTWHSDVIFNPDIPYSEYKKNDN